MEPEFDTYLADKKIDSQAFSRNEPEKWQSFKRLFDQVHPDSFTTQKKFLINDLRRSYPLTLTQPMAEDTKAEEPKKAARPVMKRPLITKKPETGNEETGT